MVSVNGAEYLISTSVLPVLPKSILIASFSSSTVKGTSWPSLVTEAIVRYFWLTMIESSMASPVIVVVPLMVFCSRFTSI